MSKIENAKNQLNVASAFLTGQFKRTASIRQSTINNMKTNVQMKNFGKAYECLTLVGSSFDNEGALKYLMESLKNVKNNLPIIFESKVCPPSVAVDVAAMCYAAKQNYFEAVTKFVQSFFVPLWKAKEVENLAHSSIVPKELSKLKRPDMYTLEELHIFAHECERTLHIDMTWFYENYPINKDRPPETKVDVKVMGRSISKSDIVSPFATQKQRDAMERAKTAPEVKGDFPPPKQFKVEDFIDMETEINETLKRWKDYDL